MAVPPNPCAGRFGAVYDFYIEREWLTRTLGRALWGVKLAELYATMEAIGRTAAGATILDVPCGGGVALRALRPEQEVRYVAGDLSEATDSIRAGRPGLQALVPTRRPQRVARVRRRTTLEALMLPTPLYY